MALIVEDGTGLSNAESYASVSFVTQYATDRGLVWSTAVEADNEAALRRATVWLDARYRNRFVGYKINRRDQALEWPRHDAYDRNGDYISYLTVPVEVAKANAEAAILELANPGVLSPLITTGEIARRIKVDVIEIEYARATALTQDQRPISTVVEDIMGSLLVSIGGSRLAGKTARC